MRIPNATLISMRMYGSLRFCKCLIVRMAGKRLHPCIRQTRGGPYMPYSQAGQ